MSYCDHRYKRAFTDFIITSLTWHWFITIPIGDCEDDELVLKRLRRIENELCKKYLVNRYSKLPANARFTIAIAFEGERELGVRHAHILAYVPQPTKKRISHGMAIDLFPSEFRARWELQNNSTNRDDPSWTFIGWGNNKRNSIHHLTGFEFGESNRARIVYTLKHVRPDESPWSRFEFVTAPKSKKFSSGNSSVVHNRNLQRRSHLYRLGELPDRTRSQIAS
jgi:hypothetical protein